MSFLRALPPGRTGLALIVVCCCSRSDDPQRSPPDDSRVCGVETGSQASALCLQASIYAIVCIKFGTTRTQNRAGAPPSAVEMGVSPSLMHWLAAFLVSSCVESPLRLKEKEFCFAGL